MMRTNLSILSCRTSQFYTAETLNFILPKVSVLYCVRSQFYNAEHMGLTSCSPKSMKAATPEVAHEAEMFRDHFKEFYEFLKTVQGDPKKTEHAKQWFRKLVNTPTTSVVIGKVLQGLKKIEEDALRCLDAAWTPLHNNDSERALARYVKRRTISGSTKNEHGRVFRDTLLSIRETCDRLRMPFADYLLTICKGSHVDLGLVIRDVYTAKYPDSLPITFI